MRRQKRTVVIAGLGSTAILAAVLTTGAAWAKIGPTTPTPGNGTATTSQVTPAEKPGPDTDAVQQGDQTTPDQPGAAEHEKAGAEQERTTEADGPGGHADPAGNVDHQFEGEE